VNSQRDNIDSRKYRNQEILARRFTRILMANSTLITLI